MAKGYLSLASRLRVILDQISYSLRTFRLVWTAAGRLTLVWAILLVIQGLLPVATVSLTRLLVDGLVAARDAGGSWHSMQPLLIVAAAMALIVLLTEALQSAGEWIRTAQSEFLRDHVSALAHQQSVTVDLALYESPDYFDRLYRTQSEAAGRPLALVENAGALVQNGITLLGMATILTAYGWWLPLVVAASALPAFSVVSVFNRRYHRWWKETTTDRRWTDYYDLMLKHPGAAAEVRLFGLGSYFQSAYRALRRRLRTERLRMIKEQGLARLAAGVSGLLLPGALMAWMVWRTAQGSATLGDLALFFQALNRGQSLIRSLLQNVSQIHATSLYLESLFEFLELKPEVVDSATPVPASPPRIGIRFRQVTFRYPGSERSVLQNLNLTVAAGHTVAIVGPNGAGKSTLLKLLCRFYDPAAGCIELDGIDIRRFPIEELRRLITVLFQSPVPYHATVGQNIAISNLPAAPDAAAIEAAARAAGAHDFISHLHRGYDTLLGKVFADGTDLSGGEWQRLALARAFLRSAPIIILDEPTSFMDSWTEAEWFERFRTLARGRTAIVITHRFTIAMRADVIHVMDQGRIVESGSHHELLALGGRYAQSWAAQMQPTARAVPPGAQTAPNGHEIQADCRGQAAVRDHSFTEVL